MKIKIGPESTIKDVQTAFSEVYPYLRVDFYKTHHKTQELFEDKDMIAPTKLFGLVSKSITPKTIDISPNRKVSDLEKTIYKKLGIAMQVSRRSGDLWLQTSKTDDWTLAKQNQSGQAMIPQSATTPS
ncbi:hypothetical protein KUV50_12675 [Membranicola marinus]|uniref:Uncharacterized protein n=1 Tax=Membranihabitans marinus TaxID=1227546 RepID=A0A953HWC0_9BACT|nr:hypothetical protein [Membranihabitans marinus]MBY5958998.1 hypothetical protein [Membranihabitans marinus]